MPNRLRPISLCLAAALAACSKSSPQTPPPVSYGTPGTQASFDLTADLTEQANWNAMPWPSDLRLTAAGNPDFSSFPNPSGLDLVESFRTIAMQTHGFSVVSTAYFLFSNTIAPHAADPMDAGLTQPIFLIDVDPSSPDMGTTYPITIDTPVPDDYTPSNLLAVAPRPGIVLAPNVKYAVVVTRDYKDAAGNPAGVPSYLDMMRQGITPPTQNGAAALALYAPVFKMLQTAGVDTARIAALTIFTTGDAVAEDAALYQQLVDKYPVTIDNLALDTAMSPGNTRACRFTATVTFPQFQVGTPPYDSDGLFAFGADGLPIQQRVEVAPMVILLPRLPMPAAGYPLLQYFHGSGGLSTAVADMGPTLFETDPPMLGGDPVPNEGPGWVHAESGIASFGAALPVNPERLPMAGDTAYLNLLNPAAMRDTFRQGVIEQRMLLKAMLALKIDPSLLANCTGGALPTLPTGAGAPTQFQFDGDHVIIQGQSMGGMYANLVAAVEPKAKIVVPTGAGGFWTFFILKTQLYTGIPTLLAQLLKTGTPLTQLHPVLHLLQTGYEPNDPYIAMPRVGKRPLPGHPTRPIYEMMGKDDEYFPMELYDAVALNYGHQEAGTPVPLWSPDMQGVLALGGLQGLLDFPVTNNRTSKSGVPYTGVVVQYVGDGIEDPHQIYRQLGQVKYQYRCFVSSWLATGVATLPAEGAQEAACP